MRFLLLSFAFLIAPLLSANAADEVPITSHEKHLKKIGYWSLHQDIKSDRLSFLKKNTTIQGHKGVAYLSYLGQQIETLLAVPYPNRLLKQRDELDRLSQWVYAISTHACGFSGFDRKATPEEAKRMRRALTFSLMVSDFLQPSSVVKILHESFDPYYRNNLERQFFFKSLLCRKEMIDELWLNHINGWPAAYYKHITLPKFLEDCQRRNANAIQEVEVYRSKYQETKSLLDLQNTVKAWRDDEEWSDEEEGRSVSTEALTPREGSNSFLEQINVRVIKKDMKQMMSGFPSVDEQEVQAHRELLLSAESFLEFDTEFGNFRKDFLNCFDFEELDDWLSPYVKAALDRVGKHRTARMHVALFAPYFDSFKNDRQKMISIINDESYYDNATDDEGYNGQSRLESLKEDSDIDSSNDLLEHWKRNGTYGQFRQYFKSFYDQEVKRKRRAVLTVYSDQFFYEVLDEIEQDKSQFFERVREYKVIKQKPRQTTSIRLTAANIQSPISVFNADEIIIDSSTCKNSYSQSVNQSNCFSKQSYGQITYQEVRTPSQLHSRIIILGRKSHLTLAESTQVPPDIKIYGGSWNIKEEAPVRTWTDSWSHSSQRIPTPVVCALSIGAGVLTQGLASGLMGVAISSLTSTAVHATLTGHDPLKAVTSETGLKNLAIQVATAGVTDQLAQAMGVNMTPGAKSFVDHLKGNSLRAAVNTSLKVAMGDHNIKEALTSAVKSVGVNSVAGFASNQVGKAYGIEKMDTLSHKALHGAIGGLSGYALGGNQEAVISGAVSAIAAEVAFEVMVPKETIEKRALDIATEEIKKGNKNPQDIQRKVLESFQQERDIAKMTGLMASTSLGKESDIAWQTASTAVDNNNAIALGLRAIPAINWAIANSDKIVKGIQHVANLYNVYERTGKEAEKKKLALSNKNKNSFGGADKDPSSPRDHKGDKWEKNQDNRWHHENAKDKSLVPNKPNFENENLQKLVNEVYRKGDQYPGGSSEMLRKEVVEGKNLDHLIKCDQRLRGITKILTDPKENLSKLDRISAEKMQQDLRNAIEFVKGIQK